MPRFLGGSTGELTPPVPWAELYQCYGSPQSCGPEMARLWRDKVTSSLVINPTPTLPLPLPATRTPSPTPTPTPTPNQGATLHLLAALAALLDAWLGGARRATAPPHEQRALLEAQRQLGVVGHLDWHVSELQPQP